MTIQQAMEVAMRAHQAGDLAQAEALYRQVLSVQPQHAEALRLLGLIAHTVGQHTVALGLFDRSIAVHPQGATAHNDRGNTLLALGRAEEAVVSFRQAIAIDGAHPCAAGNLGNALRQLGWTDEALACYRESIINNPGAAVMHINLGHLLKVRGDFAGAAAAYREALRLDPRNHETHNALGVMLVELDQPDEAVATFQRALALKPDYPIAQSNLAGALTDRGELDAAVVLGRSVLARHPADAGVHSNLLYVLPFLPGCSAQEILAEAERWDAQHAAPLTASHEAHANSAEPERRLKIGYVSAHFCDHVVGRNLLPLLRAHDRERFELFCYSTAPRPDAITATFQNYASQWRDAAALSDEDLARLIRRDGIDVLIDTSLHMSGGRLLVFARKPAPVQITFAGYPGTTGLRAMDFRLTDPFLDPPGRTDHLYSEVSLRLADSFWCYAPLERDIAVSTLPAAQSGHFTFGCLNHPRKLNAPTLALWARVMTAVPQSRLLLSAKHGSHREQIARSMAESGIDAQRVQFAEPCARRDYLALYHRIDLALDTFPYQGHTTSLDALWMGVPVVTRAGESVVARAGVSQLMNLQLPELIAADDEAFVRIATDWAGELPRLAQLRASLRARMETSPLMDAPRFARSVEAALREAWRHWCTRKTG